MAGYRLRQSGEEVQGILDNAAMRAQLTAETERAQTVEQQLQTNIDSEATARQQADGVLDGKIAAEKTRAEGAEGALQTTIGEEAQSRQQADGVLDGKIAAEKTRAEGAEGALQTAIGNEAQARQQADGVLDGKIAAEKTRAEGAEQALQTAIDNEAKARRQTDGALDVSELNATENPHTLAKYVNLSAAIAAIPTDYQKGGMSIKFVQSSDNKYVQYRLMSDTFNTNEANWQGVDDVPKSISKNLVESAGANDKIQCSDIFINGITDNLNEGYLHPSGNSFINNSSGHGFVYKVHSGDVLKVKASTKTCYFALLKENVYKTGVFAKSEAATNFYLVPANRETDEITIPSDCNYILFGISDNTTSYAFPSAIYLNGLDVMKTFLHLIKDGYTRTDALKSESLGTSIEFTQGGYIVTNQGLLDDVSLNVTAASTWSYSITTVNEGDYVVITGAGGSSPRLWAFLNEDDKMIAKSDANVAGNNIRIRVPSGAKKLIINSFTETLGDCFYIAKGHYVFDSIDNLEKEAFYNDSLNQRIVDYSVPENVNLDRYPIDLIIIPSGTSPNWDSNNRAGGSFIETKGYQLFTIKNSSTTIFIAFLKTNSHIVGEAVDFCDGYTSRTNIGPNTIRDFILPSDIKYIYVYRRSDSNNAIQGIQIKLYNINPVSNAIGNAEFIDDGNWSKGKRISVIGETVDIESGTTDANHEYALLSCQEGDVFTISARGGTSDFNAWTTLKYEDNSYKVVRKSAKGLVENDTVEIEQGETFILLQNFFFGSSKYKAACFKGITNAAITNDRLLSLEDKKNWNLNGMTPGVDNECYTMWTYPGLIHTTTYRNKLIWSWADNKGFTGGGEYDLDSKVLKRRLLKKSDTDDHDMTSVTELPDGRIVFGYAGGHGYDSKQHFRITEDAEYIDNVGDEVAIDLGLGATTYNQTFKVGNTYYIFCRVNRIGWAYLTTDDFVTFTTPVQFIEAPADVQYYVKVGRVTDNPNMLRFVSYSNASITEYTDIRMGYFDIENNKILDADGQTQVSTLTPSMPSAITAFSIVVARGEDNALRLWDLLDSPMNNPVIAYTRMPVSDAGNGNNYVYNNGVEQLVCASGYIWLSRASGGIMFISDTKVIVSIGQSKRVWDIEIYEYVNGAWSKTKTVWHEDNGARSTILYDIRPLVSDDKKYVMWQRGWYKTYKPSVEDPIPFNMNLKMYDIVNDEILF